MNRDEMILRIQRRDTPWDLVIIGGGAVGAGVAVDASTRGFEVLLVEREDFGKGTSSRSTKLVHGGVRYLEQGNISLVMEALKERGLLLRNAPHIVHDLPFVVPNYSWWEAPFYGIGMKVYDLLAGKYNFGRSKVLSLAETLERLPTIQRDGLRGGVLYHDGQFDDTRLLTHLLATAADHGATVVNYAEVVSTLKGADGFLSGVVVEDHESHQIYPVTAKVVVNATGIFTDATRRLAQPDVKPMVTPAQGIHLVLDRSFLRGHLARSPVEVSTRRLCASQPPHALTYESDQKRPSTCPDPSL
jgi:glycerol-3-phosphate dehydrogenase